MGELLGGGLRIPAVKQVLQELVGDKELGQHLNGDEAMALGAAFRAANISTAFRVRKVGVIDKSSFGFSISLDTLPVEAKSGGLFGFFKSEEKVDPNAEVWHKETSLYPALSPVPAKPKTVAFLYDKDILCQLS